MQTPPLRESDYLKAWALFIVCAIAGWFAVGFVVGALLGGVLRLAGASMHAIEVVCGPAGVITGLPVSYFFFRLFVQRLLSHKLAA